MTHDSVNIIFKLILHFGANYGHRIIVNQAWYSKVEQGSSYDSWNMVKDRDFYKLPDMEARSGQN